MKKLAVVVLMMFASCSIYAQKVITLGSLLDEMIDVEEGARMPALDYKCLQSSSYDRRSVSPSQPGWFANDDGYGVVRVDTTANGLERVMLDTDGPGVVTRFWITAIDKKGVIRIYFDNEANPSVVIPAYDLMRIGIDGMEGGLLLPHTSYEKDGKGGSTMFLPMPYQKHCKVTFTYEDDTNLSPRYFQLNYRRYPKGTKVETFSLTKIAGYKDKIARVNHVLQHPELSESFSSSTSVFRLPSLSESVVRLPQGEQGVYELQFALSDIEPEQMEQAMRDVLVSMSFDGKQTVSDIPVSDLACAGMGAPAMRSFYTESFGRGMVIMRWFMPYRKSAEITLRNSSAQHVSVSVTTKTKPIKWDKRMLYFHASWRQQLGTPITTFDVSDEKAIDWNVADIKGRGVLKADMLTLYNYTKAWYGEGDEKIYVDGETFPSHFGTGTEDYYNCSWAPVVVFQTPFGGAPREDIACSLGYNTFFRTRHLDGIPFNKGLKFDLEMLGWQNGKADVAATTIWYGTAESECVRHTPHDAEYQLPPVPADPANWHLEGAIEIEDLELTEKPEGIATERQMMLSWPEYDWSGSRQFFCINGKPGQSFSFEIPAEGIEGEHELLLYATKAPDYGIVDFSIDGSTPVRFNGYNNKVELAGPLSLGRHAPKNGKYRLTITINGTDEKSVGARYMWGLDCVIIK